MAESLDETFDRIKTPQFFDFNKIDQDESDDNGYFEQEHELDDPLHTSDYFDETTLLAEDIERVNISNFRRSLSFGDLNLRNVCKLRSGKVYKTIDLCEDKSANSSRYTTDNTRPSLKENLTRLARPKKHYGSEQNLSSNEYVPMAEAVKKFQHGTPKRFRSRPNLTMESTQPTIPHSPKLKTSVRSRPVHVLSRWEREELELEEAKKSQFKANPINKKIFKSNLVTNEKVKKTTIPEPFKLTAPPKKVSDSPTKKAPEFHARPVPKCVYEPQIPVIKAPLRTHVTIPLTPSFMKHRSHSPETTTTLPTQKQIKLKPTRPVPFSFERRDKLMISKKEQLIQRVLETEKRAREFHAKPVPKSVMQPTRAFSFKSGPKKSFDNVSKADVTLNTTCFKAKPPTVLYKKPFEPKRENRPLLEIDDFVLNTDIRGRQREHFDQMIKDKEERLMMLRQQKEMIMKQQEAEEVQRVRKNAEFRAQEIKKYKEVVIKPSMKVTQPISPKFLSNKAKNRSGNKENTP